MSVVVRVDVTELNDAACAVFEELIPVVNGVPAPVAVMALVNLLGGVLALEPDRARALRLADAVGQDLRDNVARRFDVREGLAHGHEAGHA